VVSKQFFGLTRCHRHPSGNLWVIDRLVKEDFLIEIEAVALITN
jgi:hypothetical protein